MKATFIFVTLQLFGLYLPPNFGKIVYRPFSYSPRVTMCIPKGYTLERSTAEGNAEYLYKYPDSSFFYISSFPTPHSYEEIRKLNAFYDKENAFRAKKEFLLSGTDSSGLFWQDKTIMGLSIGFYHVSSSRLPLMAEAMKTLKIN